MKKTKIDWADYTWNPVWGCMNNCPYCYARGIAQRFTQLGRQDFKPMWLEDAFNKPFPKRPSIIFVNSMSDPICWKGEWIERVNARIAENPQHTFIVLTKDDCLWSCWSLKTPDNLKFGITLDGNKKSIIDYCICDYPEFFDFVNFEPILGDFTDDELCHILDAVHSVGTPQKKQWAIIGAETGNRKGKVEPHRDWVTRIVDVCIKRGIPVFMKESLRPYCKLWGIEFIQENPYRKEVTK